MNDFSDRLKTERKRLGLNQDEFSALGGVKKGAQFNYENGSRFPDAAYLIALALAGVDTHYLITGSPQSSNLDEYEIELVTGFRKLDARGKAGVLGTVTGLSEPSQKNSTVINGGLNHVVQGNQTVKTPVKLKISTTKKKL